MLSSQELHIAQQEGFQELLDAELADAELAGGDSCSEELQAARQDVWRLGGGGSSDGDDGDSTHDGDSASSRDSSAEFGTETGGSPGCMAWLLPTQWLLQKGATRWGLHGRAAGAKPFHKSLPEGFAEGWGGRVCVWGRGAKAATA